MSRRVVPQRMIFRLLLIRWLKKSSELSKKRRGQRDKRHKGLAVERKRVSQSMG